MWQGRMYRSDGTGSFKKIIRPAGHRCDNEDEVSNALNICVVIHILDDNLSNTNRPYDPIAAHRRMGRRRASELRLSQ